MCTKARERCNSARSRRLSSDHRNALIEIYFRGRSYEEVALEFAIPTGTVKSRVYYALKALRLALEELGWNGDE